MNATGSSKDLERSTPVFANQSPAPAIAMIAWDAPVPRFHGGAKNGALVSIATEPPISQSTSKRMNPTWCSTAVPTNSEQHVWLREMDDLCRDQAPKFELMDGSEAQTVILEFDNPDSSEPRSADFDRRVNAHGDVAAQISSVHQGMRDDIARATIDGERVMQTLVVGMARPRRSELGWSGASARS